LGGFVLGQIKEILASTSASTSLSHRASTSAALSRRVLNQKKTKKK
jgi:hypothetical protein